jgi:hypothetical protein
MRIRVWIPVQKANAHPCGHGRFLNIFLFVQYKCQSSLTSCVMTMANKCIHTIYTDDGQLTAKLS